MFCEALPYPSLDRHILCGADSFKIPKYECKMLKVIVKFRQNHSHVTAFFKKLQSFKKKITIIFMNFTSLFKFCSHISKIAVT